MTSACCCHRRLRQAVGPFEVHDTMDRNLQLPLFVSVSGGVRRAHNARVIRESPATSRSSGSHGPLPGEYIYQSRRPCGAGGSWLAGLYLNTGGRTGSAWGVPQTLRILLRVVWYLGIKMAGGQTDKSVGHSSRPWSRSTGTAVGGGHVGSSECHS